MPELRRRVSRDSEVEFLLRHRFGRTLIHGQRGIGKRLILREMIDRARDDFSSTIWIPLQTTSLNPENFALEFSTLVLRELGYADIEPTVHDFSRPPKALPVQAISLLKSIANELEKVKPDQQLLIQNAIGIVDAAAKPGKKRPLIVLEDIHRLLEMNNFSQIKDIFSILDLEARRFSVMGTTPYGHLTTQHLEGFELLEVRGFSVGQTVELCRAFGVKDKKACEELHALTGGHPQTLALLLEDSGEEQDSVVACKTAMAAADSRASLRLEASLTEGLAMARGATMLRSILHVLCQKDDSRLSDVARAIFHSAPVTKSLLARLVEVGMVRREGKGYRMANRAMANRMAVRRTGVRP
ncbi:MAG: hypothetical protein ABIC95_03460 [archaeon]